MAGVFDGESAVDLAEFPKDVGVGEVAGAPLEVVVSTDRLSGQPQFRLVGEPFADQGTEVVPDDRVAELGFDLPGGLVHGGGMYKGLCERRVHPIDGWAR